MKWPTKAATTHQTVISSTFVRTEHLQQHHTIGTPTTGSIGNARIRQRHTATIQTANRQLTGTSAACLHYKFAELGTLSTMFTRWSLDDLSILLSTPHQCVLPGQIHQSTDWNANSRLLMSVSSSPGGTRMVIFF